MSLPSDEIHEALIAFTQEIEEAHARLLREVREEVERLREEGRKTEQTVASLKEELASLKKRLVEGQALSDEGEGEEMEAPKSSVQSPAHPEAQERIRWRHPEIWKMVQGGWAAEEIAERSHRSLGEIRLILHLMGEPEKTPSKSLEGV